MQSVSKLVLLTALTTAMPVPARASQPAEKPKGRFTLVEKVAGTGLVVGSAILGYLIISGEAKIAFKQWYGYRKACSDVAEGKKELNDVTSKALHSFGQSVLLGDVIMDNFVNGGHLHHLKKQAEAAARKANRPTEGDFFMFKKERPTLIALGIAGLGVVTSLALLAKERVARKKSAEQGREA